MMQDFRASIDVCNKCGFCQAGCPVYKATGIEWMTARGRIALIKDALDGRLEFDEEMREPLFNCLTCNGCTDHCPPGVPTAEIVIAAREELLRRQGQPWVEQLLFRNVLPNPSLVSALGKALRLGQETGLLSLLGRLGPGNILHDVAGILPHVPSQDVFAVLKPFLEPIANPKYRVAYFVGCAAANFFPEVAAATTRVLRRHRAQVVVPRFVCCGKPAQSYGDSTASKVLAKRNLDLAEELAVDAIVTACATCSSFLKEYPVFFSGDEAYDRKAREFSAKVKDIGEFLIDIGLDERLGPVEKKVTWHDPCHLGRYQKLSGPARQILKSIPSIEFIELPEANVCCGGAGLYNLTHSEVSTKVLERKMANVSRTGADLLVTSCPSCAIQLNYGARTHRVPAKTVELVQVLDEAYRACES